MDWPWESVIALAAAVEAREVSALEVVDAALDAIDRIDPALNACCDVRPDEARAQARAVDAALTGSGTVGPLAGVPLGVKDLEDAAGFRTAFGDPAHRDDPPRPADSIETARLRAAGCIVVAKTNTPAYGFHAETDNLVFGPTRNPWAPERSAGGSSGGSAAAVASGMLPLCTGSDGGGSIRIPSAACGISGFKPTNGVVPAGDDGAPVWGPFSTRGPMARTFAEIAAALDVVKGFSARDLLSVRIEGSFAAQIPRASVEGVRIAWCPQTGLVEPERRVVERCEAALRELEAHGARIEEIPSVFSEPPVLAWVRRAGAGTLKIVGDPEGWPERFLPEATNLARAVQGMGMADVVAGEDGAHRAGLELAAVFSQHDVLATPAMGGPPPRHREPHPLGPGWAGDFTLPFNLTRSPAAVVCAGTVVEDGDELPVALQLAAPRLADLDLMRVAAAAEAILGAPRYRPSGAIGAGGAH